MPTQTSKQSPQPAEPKSWEPESPDKTPAPGSKPCDSSSEAPKANNWKPIHYKSGNNFDTEAWSNECSTKDFGESLTVQSQATDADLNVIMERFRITGQMPDTVRPVFYADFDDIVDFRTAQDAVVRANQAFNDLPPQLRSRFGNDPQNFLEFCSDQNNKDEMHKLGLLRDDYKPPQTEITTPPATPLATPPKEGK